MHLSARQILGDFESTLKKRLETVPTMRHTDALVSVIVTTFNSEDHVRRSVRSLLQQSHSNLELIAVDDASSDGTVAALREIQHADSRLRVLRCYRNRGTYWAKNLGLMHARGEFLAFQDSDDISVSDRLRKQLAALRADDHKIVSTCNYVRVDSGGRTVLNRGLVERRGFITMVLSRDVLMTAGYFDSVRKGADEEYFRRLRRLFGDEGIAHTQEALYRALVRSDSLTSGGEVDLSSEQVGSELGHLTEDRRAYLRASEKWHNESRSLRMPFPLGRRPFPVRKSLAITEPPKSAFVTASMASIPSRKEGLRAVVDSILPQVDRLNVYLNNYEDVPGFLGHPKIAVARSQDHGDRRDNGKFYFASNVESGYHFTLDDDIAYPPDYVAFSIAKLQQFDHLAVIGYHGRILPDPIVRFFSPVGATVLSFKHELLEDRQVHVLGTGTVGYHTSTIEVDKQDFQTAGMADLWLAVLAQDQGVPMIAVAREEGFLEQIDGLSGGSLFDEFSRDDHGQTRIARERSPWKFPLLNDSDASQL